MPAGVTSSLLESVLNGALVLPGKKPKANQLRRQMDANVERLIARFARERLLETAT